VANCFLSSGSAAQVGQGVTDEPGITLAGVPRPGGKPIELIKAGNGLHVPYHASSHLAIGKRTTHGANVLHEVIRVRGRRECARDCRMRDDPLEEELGPALDAELLGKGRERPAADELVQPCLFKRHIHENGDAAISGGWEEPFLRESGVNRVADLHEVELSPLHPVRQDPEIGRLVMGHAEVANPSLLFPSLHERHDHIDVDQGVKYYDHPEAGRLTFDYIALEVTDERLAPLRLVTYVSAPGTDTQEKIAGLLQHTASEPLIPALAE
jgi:hypothetical protein